MSWAALHVRDKVFKNKSELSASLVPILNARYTAPHACSNSSFSGSVRFSGNLLLRAFSAVNAGWLCNSRTHDINDEDHFVGVSLMKFDNLGQSHHVDSARKYFLCISEE